MAVKGMGTKVKIGANAIALLKSISGFGMTADTIERTNFDSNGYREFAQGMKDGGEVTIGGSYYPGDTNGQAALFNLYDSGALTPFSVIFPAEMGADFGFNGIVTSFNVTPDLEGDIDFEATIKVSGKPTLGLVASAGLSALSLTGAAGALTPTFANGIYSYAFSGVTATSVTVTATAASHTLKLFVDGVYVQDLTSGSASSAIAMAAIGSKMLTIIANEAGKTQKIYEVVVVKTA